jgi:hypothetical protein
VETNGAVFWSMNKDNAKRLTAYERKVLRRMFGRIKLSEKWRNRSNKDLLQLFGDLDIFSFVRISRWIWIGHINRPESKRK